MPRLLPPIVAALLTLGGLVSTAHADPSRLVVLVVMDQLGQHQLVRFAPVLKGGGLARLAREGRSYDGHYAHAPTYTAPGHATIITGASPRQHGIVSNKFRDVDGRMVTSVQGHTPKRLLVETVGDRLIAETGGRARVVTVGLKDRAALLTAGHAGTLAVWFDKRRGVLTSRPAAPGWLLELNAEQPAARWFGEVWTRLHPNMDYVALTGPDLRPGEDLHRFDGRVFPHRVSAGLSAPGKDFYSRFRRTPWATALTFEAARRAVEAHAMGADETPDLLVITLAASDYVGHVFGPYSHEALDHLMRADRMLGDFFSWLDTRIPGRWDAVFTADHGVAPLPEVTQAQGIPAGRFVTQALLEHVESTLRESLGTRRRFVQAFKAPWLYLDNPTPTLRRLVRDALQTVPGVHSVWTSDELRDGGDGDALRAAFAEGYYPGRCGDVAILPKPHWLFETDTGLGTKHLTPYIYDAVVPLLVRRGAGDSKAGDGARSLGAPIGARPRADQRQIAPTLARLLGISPPAAALKAPLPGALE